MNEKKSLKIIKEIVDLIEKNKEEINKLRYNIKIKKDGSPVTESDILIEELIKSHIKNQTENITFIGEESYNMNSILNFNSPIAVIDPIDGTENFCSGLKIWGVGLSLWNCNKHLASLLYMPELNQKLISGDNIKPLQSRIHGFSSSLNEKTIQSIATQQESRIFGCSIYNLYNVITGSFRSFSNQKGAYIWDILPGLMLAVENNCIVKVNGKDFNGQFLNPNQKYCFEIHNK